MKRGTLLRILLVLLGSALLFEGGVRLLLFSNLTADFSIAQRLRKPRLFAHANVEDLFWLLHREFFDGPVVTPPDYHPRLGWVGSLVSPRDLRHVHENEIGDRRPVLLYGDSFSRCMTLEGACFEDLMQADELGRTHCLLNYGVVGYGLDQTATMVELTQDLYADRDPIVVVGVFVDDDLDRCALSFRSSNKPRMDADGVMQPASPVPSPLPRTVSYGLRLLLHREPLFSSWLHQALCPLREINRENRLRCQRVIDYLARVLTGGGHPHFVVLFAGRSSIQDPGGSGWREAFLCKRLDALGIPWVTARGPMLAHARAGGRPITDYYQQDGHLNALGNYAAFRAIRDGMDGRFGDRDDYAFTPSELAGPPLTPDRIDAIDLGGERAAAKYELNDRPPFVHRDEFSRLAFRVAGRRPTEVSYRTAGHSASFEGVARFIPMGRLGPGQGSVRLTLLGDGETLFQAVVKRGDPDLPVRVDLAGVQAFTVRVDSAGDGKRGDWMMLASPLFH